MLKELRLAGISDIEAANAFLPDFTERYNAKFAKTPRRSDNLHRALNIEPDRLRDVFCFRDQRYVGKQLSFSYERKRIILDETEITRGLVGKYVDTFAFPDGQLEIRWKGVSLPYSAFDKDQRVTHAAITENKRLGTVLEFIKAEQEKDTPPKTNPLANSARVTRRPVASHRAGLRRWKDIMRAAAPNAKPPLS